MTIFVCNLAGEYHVHVHLPNFNIYFPENCQSKLLEHLWSGRIAGTDQSTLNRNGFTRPLTCTARLLKKFHFVYCLKYTSLKFHGSLCLYFLISG